MREIERMLDSYERGKISRRDFVAAIAALTALPRRGSADEAKPLFKTSNLNHVTLSVSDPKKSCAFYQRLFGLSVLQEDAEGCNLAVGSRFISLSRYPHGRTGYIDHFCLGIEDFSFDKSKQMLAEQKLNPFVEFGTQVYFHDPDGTKVQISSADYKGSLA